MNTNNIGVKPLDIYYTILILPRAEIAKIIAKKAYTFLINIITFKVKEYTRYIGKTGESDFGAFSS